MISQLGFAAAVVAVLTSSTHGLTLDPTGTYTISQRNSKPWPSSYNKPQQIVVAQVEGTSSKILLETTSKSSPFQSAIPALPGCAVRIKSVSMCGMVIHQPWWKVSDPKNKFSAFTMSGGSKSATVRLGNSRRVGGSYEYGFTRYQSMTKTGSIGQAIKLQFYQSDSRRYGSGYNYRLCGGSDKYGVNYRKYDYDIRAYNSVRHWMEFDYKCLAACPKGEFRKDPNAAACTKCTACSSGTYGVAGTCSSNGGDRKCTACDSAPDKTFYQRIKCSSSSNAVWAECDGACTNNQVELKKCQPASNRMCLDKSTVQTFITQQATDITNVVNQFKVQTTKDIESLTIKVDDELKVQLADLKKVLTNQLADLKTDLTADIESVTDEFGVFKQALKEAFSSAATMTSSFGYAEDTGLGSGDGPEQTAARIKSSQGTLKITVAKNAHMIVNNKMIATADEITASIDEIVKQTYTSISEKIE